MLILQIYFLLAVSVGLGWLLPSPFKSGDLIVGYRAFIGISLLPLMLFAAVVILRLGFDLAFIAVVMFSLVGGFRAFIALRARITEISAMGAVPWVSYLAHPMVLLPAMIGVVGLVSGPVDFKPYGDDTYANWLSHAKQIWLVNDYWYTGMHSAGRGYPPGWHFLLVFAAGFWGTFSDTLALAAPAAMHIALLAVTFDLLVRELRHRHHGSIGAGTGIGLTIVFFLLVIEASWELLPSLVLSTMPLFYTSIGFFVLAYLYWQPGVRPMALTGALSVVIVAHYLLKSQGLALVPVGVGLIVVGVVGRFPARRDQVANGTVSLAMALVPLVAVMLTWKAMGPGSMKCNANPLAILSGGISGMDGQSDVWLGLARDLIVKTGTYLASYKLPVSVMAFLGLGLALFQRHMRWVSLGVIAYAGAYIAAVYLAYLGCPDGFNQYLSSLQRYLQLPVRTVHFVGVLMLLLWAVGLARGRGLKAISRPLMILAVALGGYQLFALSRSFTQINEPAIDATFVRYLRSVPETTERILRLAREKGMRRPRVLMAYVYWEHFPYLVARHNGFPSTRKAIPGGVAGLPFEGREALARWDLVQARYASQNGPGPVEGGDSTNLASFDIIWVEDRIKDVTDRLRGLVDDPECVANPNRFFIVRSPEPGDRFECVARE